MRPSSTFSKVCSVSQIGLAMVRKEYKCLSKVSSVVLIRLCSWTALCQSWMGIELTKR